MATYLRPAAALFPSLKGPGIDANLERKHLARHVEGFACFANELRVDSRDGDGFHVMRPKSHAPLAVFSHRLDP